MAGKRTRTPARKGGSGQNLATNHPYRFLAVFTLLVIGTYLLVFLTGDRKPTPELGIDLRGGTSVTLSPVGGQATDEQLRQAQEILRNRVNGLGVSGSTVVVDGKTLVITVPGDNSSQARALGTTSKLLFRPVVGGSAAAPPPPAAPAEDRPETGDDAARTARLEADRRIFQATDGAAQQAALAQLDCSGPHPLAGADDPALPLVTCGAAGERYVLGPAYTVPKNATPGAGAVYLDGNQVDGDSVSSNFDQQRSQHQVVFQFKRDTGGSQTWADVTSELQGTGRQLAVTLDSKVLSAPQVTSATPVGSSTTISGSFTADSARELANNLRYGALPLSFDVPNTRLISPTQGSAALKAGLIAGAVGLVLVLLYSLAYYRALGVLVALSLVASGALVYASIVLLGRWIGFTLDLAGIAGLVIGIGMTADSFVVFFERIKDEIRAGRTFRSAVPRGWKRATRTIWSGNAVTLIAAAVLYVLAVGEVKGFAFTMGLTTIFDLVIVFLVTAPLVHLASRTALFARPSLNGLGSTQAVVRSLARHRPDGGTNGAAAAVAKEALPASSDASGTVPTPEEGR